MMTPEPAQQDEVSAELPGGTKFRARGYDIIAILVLLAVTINAAFLYMHMGDTRVTGEAVVSTNKEVAKAQQEMVKSLRLQTCILATKEGSKEQEYMQPNSFCNRMSQ